MTDNAHTSRLKSDQWIIFGGCKLYRELREQYPNIVPDRLTVSVGVYPAEYDALMMMTDEGRVYRIAGSLHVMLYQSWYDDQLELGAGQVGPVGGM